MTDQDTFSPPVVPLGPPPAGGVPAGRHLSWFRVFLVFAVVAAAIGGTWWFGFHRDGFGLAAAGSTSWFAPYVDVTATPSYAFEDASASGPTSAVLGFVVSAKGAACEPSWGTAYSMAAASDALDLDRRVARVRQLGGAVTVSFGGAANSELSIGCTDPAKLAAAYQSVIDRYSTVTVDLDIEGSASSAPAVNARRAAAMATVSKRETAAGHPLALWLTLPVGTGGLTVEGLSVLTSMLAAQVQPAGVNGMTMDYGEPLASGQTMATVTEQALSALQQQITSAYATAGINLADVAGWQRVGATPMIGQNDTADEVFGLADAQDLLAFAQAHHLGRLSMWSANRDQACGPNYPDVQVVSDACSGVAQDIGEFGSILGQFGAPTATGSTTITTTAGPTPTGSTASAPPTSSGADDPATSPYEIWNVNVGYPKGAKVVWHHNVYQAKWFSIGDQPDTPVATAAQTPWTLIGPVLPGDHPVPTPTLPAGTYPTWSAKTVYLAGTRVMLDGVGYQAKYWTQGDQPGAAPQSPNDVSPWQLITSVSPAAVSTGAVSTAATG